MGEDLRISVGHPLDGEGRPSQRVGVQRVVEERCVLLPYLVLLENALLFQLLGVVHCKNDIRNLEGAKYKIAALTYLLLRN